MIRSVIIIIFFLNVFIVLVSSYLFNAQMNMCFSSRAARSWQEMQDIRDAQTHNQSTNEVTNNR